MKSIYLWTRTKARLKFIRSTPSGDFHWLFLPGGPGLGSESLAHLTKILKLPGSMWHVDLPGDGSNLVERPEYYFKRWANALLEAVCIFDKPILVAHSSSGMFALSIKPLKKILSGLVLIGSAPDAFWEENYSCYLEKHPFPLSLTRLQQRYAKNPSNTLLKKLTVAAAPYFLTPKSLRKYHSFFENLPYNTTSHCWFDHHFPPTYRAAWLPTNMPALIFTGEQDVITPLSLFRSKKAYQRKNILLHEIKHAAHFPWMDNPQEVSAIFARYCNNLLQK